MEIFFGAIDREHQFKKAVFELITVAIPYKYVLAIYYDFGFREAPVVFWKFLYPV